MEENKRKYKYNSNQNSEINERITFNKYVKDHPEFLKHNKFVGDKKIYHYDKGKFRFISKRKSAFRKSRSKGIDPNKFIKKTIIKIEEEKYIPNGISRTYKYTKKSRKSSL